MITKKYILIFLMFLLILPFVAAQETSQGFFERIFDWFLMLFKDKTPVIESNETNTTLEYTFDCEDRFITVTEIELIPFAQNQTVCSDVPANLSCETVVFAGNLTKKTFKQKLKNFCDKKKSLKYGYDKIDYVESGFGGCNECGKKEIVCWKKGDGWSDHRNDWSFCECLSGESCAVFEMSGKNLKVKKGNK